MVKEVMFGLLFSLMVNEYLIKMLELMTYGVIQNLHYNKYIVVALILKVTLNYN